MPRPQCRRIQRMVQTMARIIEYIKIALMNIRGNKGRSFLTMLGIIIGMSSRLLEDPCTSMRMCRAMRRIRSCLPTTIWT